MIYGFDTDQEHEALAALVTYAVYRSRDRGRYKSAPDMWEQIERFAKGAAKRAVSLAAYAEALKPKLCCGTIHPRWTVVGAGGEVPLLVYRNADTGALSHAIQRARPDDQREFLTTIYRHPAGRAAVRFAYRAHGHLIALVRDRLEREKPIEAELDTLETIDA